MSDRSVGWAKKNQNKLSFPSIVCCSATQPIAIAYKDYLIIWRSQIIPFLFKLATDG